MKHNGQKFYHPCKETCSGYKQAGEDAREEIILEIERRMDVNESFIKKLDDFNMKKNAILQRNTLANLLSWIKRDDDEK